MVSSVYVSVMTTETYVHDTTCGLRKSEISEFESRDKARDEVGGKREREMKSGKREREREKERAEGENQLLKSDCGDRQKTQKQETSTSIRSCESSCNIPTRCKKVSGQLKECGKTSNNTGRPKGETSRTKKNDNDASSPPNPLW